jgi:hypothetical protein
MIRKLTIVKGKPEFCRISRPYEEANQYREFNRCRIMKSLAAEIAKLDYTFRYDS